MVPLLSSPHITLLPYSINHIEQTVAWLNKAFIQNTFGARPGITIEQHKDWLKNNEDTLKWAIHDDEYLGNLFLFLNLKHRSGYVQIYLGNESKTGKKLGYHAMTLALDYVFKELNMHRIWLHCLPDNVVAIKLYSKLGFSFEGLERESILKEKQFISQERWALLKNEWLGRMAYS